MTTWTIFKVVVRVLALVALIPLMCLFFNLLFNALIGEYVYSEDAIALGILICFCLIVSGSTLRKWFNG